LTARSTSRRISCEAYGVSRLHRTFAHKTTPAMKTAPSQLLRFACACRSAPTLVLRFHCRDFAIHLGRTLGRGSYRECREIHGCSRGRRSGQRDLVLSKVLAVGVHLHAPQHCCREGDVRSVQPLSLRHLDLTVHGIVAAFGKLLLRDDGLILIPSTSTSTPASRSRLGLRGRCRARILAILIVRSDIPKAKYYRSGDHPRERILGRRLRPRGRAHDDGRRILGGHPCERLRRWRRRILRGHPHERLHWRR